MARNGASRRPLWLIAKHNNGRMDVLTLSSNRGEEVLPIFSHEEEAEAFLGLQAPGESWRARETTTGELVSLHYGLCASIEKVMLDPLPVAVDNWVVVDLTGPGRENFLRSFLGVDEPSFANQSERVRGNRYARRGGALNGTSGGSDDLYIPDYVMQDFGPSNDSGDGHDA